MIHIEDFTDPSAEFVVRLLESGQTIEMTLPSTSDTADNRGVGCVRFFPMDRYCGDCGDELREYGEDADFPTVAAQIKRKYDRTLCPDCHDSLAQQQHQPQQQQHQPDESHQQPTTNSHP